MFTDINVNLKEHVYDTDAKTVGTYVLPINLFTCGMLQTGVF